MMDMLKRFTRLFKPLIVVKKLTGEVTVIDKRCKICVHPQRAEIEQKLLQGASYEEIEKEYGMSHASVSRHFKKHMPRLVMDQAEMEKLYQEHRVKVIDLQEELFRIISRLENLFQKLEKFDETFFSGARKISPHAYIESIAERRQILAQIKETLTAIEELKTEIKTEKDLSELLKKLKESQKD
ncbi:MAG: hypothetical protein QW692_04240 [Nitrososphaerota archaeon]